jgi:myo-inositol-1(or 4)-monophosphatase
MIPSLSEVEWLARQAGEILRGGYGHRHRVDNKGIIDLVTEVDHESEAFLIGEIKRRYPDHRILAEESGSQSGDQCCQWYIDPLDGTINYAHGVPVFAVSLALQVEGELRLGVVYDPMRDECFSAEADSGARLNGEPIRVSAAQDLLNSLLVTGFPYDIRTNPDNNLDHYTRFSLLCQGVRRLGSAALDLAYVACGRFDGFWELRLGPWDVAAGALIALEAGAKVSDIHGGPEYFPFTKSILAANPTLHAQMRDVLALKG